MELRTLRYFLAVAQEENITKAAAILHVFVERNTEVSGVISLGATESIGSRLFAKLIKQFSEKYPLVQFHLYNEMANE